ncbi:MAG: RES domain-containing protein [Prevotella sp.]|nr:RES domain-containing protein [Prevotella sp.]
MGRIKEMMMEKEEEWNRGYTTPTKKRWVCGCHFCDPYLSEYIIDKGKRGRCSYCHKVTTVLRLSDFIDYVGGRIVDYLGPIDNEALYLSGSFYDSEDEVIPGFVIRDSYIAPEGAEYYEDVSDVMEDFGLVTDDESLNNDIEDCFHVDRWIRKDPTALLMSEELLCYWRDFATLVKKRSRYTFFRNDNHYGAEKDNGNIEHDIIAEVSSMVQALEEIIPAGTKLYRGRAGDDDKPITKFEDLTAAPFTKAKNNRMSPRGIAMFYGSFDRITSQNEVQHYLPDKTRPIYIGEFETTQDLRVINLCNIPEPDFWMPETGDWQKYTFLYLFHEEISKPVEEIGEQLEYIPSQVFSEYLRLIQKSKDGYQYDGIIYRSSLAKGRNVVLFYDDVSSKQVLKLNDASVSKEYREVTQESKL